MIYMVNGPGKGKRRKKRRSAKQKAATRKMLAARKKKLSAKRARPAATKARTTRRSNMAKRKRSSTSKRRRRTTRHRGAPVRLVRRGRTVYQGNPRRRHHRTRRYHRNPGFLGIIKQGAMDSIATLGGGAAARIASGFIPLADAGIIGAAKGVGVAVVLGMVSRKFLSSDTARFVTAGAMQVPIKNLITSFMPAAGAYLGDYDNVGSYEVGEGEDMGDYLQSGGMSGDEMEVGEYVESYQ
jgi:hypothetical protein